MATVQSLMTTCLLRFGQDQTNQRFVDDFYNALNDAQNDVATSRSWGFLKTSANLTLVESTRTVALPSDFMKPYDERGALRYTAPTANVGDTVQLMTMDEWYANFFDDGTSEGQPTYAYIMGDSLYLSPIPDLTTYTLSMIYYKRPATIADTSSTITIPTAYQELLKKMVFRRLQDSGYSSIGELQISDADIQRLTSGMVRDDIAKYGGFNMNLQSTTFSRRTV